VASAARFLRFASPAGGGQLGRLGKLDLAHEEDPISPVLPPRRSVVS
jgi:hypothetical protein